MWYFSALAAVTALAIGCLLAYVRGLVVADYQVQWIADNALWAVSYGFAVAYVLFGTSSLMIFLERDAQEGPPWPALIGFALSAMFALSDFLRKGKESRRASTP